MSKKSSNFATFFQNRQKKYRKLKKTHILT